MLENSGNPEIPVIYGQPVLCMRASIQLGGRHASWKLVERNYDGNTSQKVVERRPRDLSYPRFISNGLLLWIIQALNRPFEGLNRPLTGPLKGLLIWIFQLDFLDFLRNFQAS